MTPTVQMCGFAVVSGFAEILTAIWFNVKVKIRIQQLCGALHSLSLAYTANSVQYQLLLAYTFFKF